MPRKNRNAPTKQEKKELLRAYEGQFNNGLKMQEEAEELLSNGAPIDQVAAKYDDAIGSYAQALSEKPNDLDTLYNTGVIMLSLAKIHASDANLSAQFLDQAANRFEAAIAADTSRRGDTTALVHTNLGNALCAMAVGQTKSAKVPAHGRQGYLVCQAKLYEEACCHYQESDRISPNDAENIWNWGDAVAKLMDVKEEIGDNPLTVTQLFDTAQGLFHRVIQQCPSEGFDVDVYVSWTALLIAFAESRTERQTSEQLLKQAQSTIQSALALDPASGEALLQSASVDAAIASLLVDSAKSEKGTAVEHLCNADRYYAKAIDVLYALKTSSSHNELEVTTALADNCFERAKVVRDALQFAQDAGVGLSETSRQWITSTIGAGEISQQLLVTAIQGYQHVLRSKPDDATSLYNLACAYAVSNDQESCRQVLSQWLPISQSIAAIDPSDKITRQDLQHDEDFKNVVGSSWFQQIVLQFPVSS